MNFRIIGTLLLGIISTVTYAGNEVGNGGIGFWCPQTKKYFLLDFHEYELLNPNGKITSSGEDFKKILQDKLNLLSKLDSKSSAYYSKKIEQNLSQINFLEKITLNNTNDSFEIARPQGCELKQFALQQKKDNDPLTKFYFDKEIWNKIDETVKAGLILHEIIYEQFSSLGETNSIKVRKLNSFIFSSDFEKTTAAEYNKFVRDLKIPLY